MLLFLYFLLERGGGYAALLRFEYYDIIRQRACAYGVPELSALAALSPLSYIPFFPFLPTFLPMKGPEIRAPLWCRPPLDPLKSLKISSFPLKTIKNHSKSAQNIQKPFKTSLKPPREFDIFALRPLKFNSFSLWST